MENSKVPFTKENGMKCICSRCPVQSNSECAKKKIEMMMKVMNDPKMSNMVPKPEDIAGLYCSSGNATCKDIDTSQMCICGNCPVWEEYGLASGKPSGYFCRDGQAR